MNFGKMTGRNQDAIKKTAAGLLKLLNPHLTAELLSLDAVHPIVEFAIEMRKRVTDQLAIMKPEEFGDVIYACDFKGL
jgi:predicted ATP-dependent Lon-type protease